MRRVLVGGVAAALLIGGGAAEAQSQHLGTWRVNGAIAGREFSLDCKLDEKICTEVRGKKSYALTSVAAPVAGQLQWGFRLKVMLVGVALRFDGRIRGDSIAGSIIAAGQRGSFTGVRR
jgi:hypothetical protein